MKNLIAMFFYFYLFVAPNCFGAEMIQLDLKFIKAIHQVETSGRIGVIKGDNGKALGPLQIHEVYWKDACEYDKSLSSGSYSDCSNLLYSIRVATAYANRYAKKAIQDKDYETLARIHNGGPNGAKRQSTIKYWHKVWRELQ